ncbi:MAG: DUF2798 domain-containing protein [Rhodobiaceae bacterium]|nr:DUF2798 domain-containing protein [Rhodobiaceae bacterium]MCC0056281.1 DUF2798 domain-containing protein [Rhodobiaceae bacterium]
MTMTAARRKLPARYQHIVMPLVLSIFMTLLISGVSTLRSVGLEQNFLMLWPQAWLLSWMVAFPALLLVLPFVRRIVGMLVENPSGH